MDYLTFQHRCVGLLYDSIKRVGFLCVSSGTNDLPFLFHNLAISASPLLLLMYQLDMLLVAGGFQGIDFEDLKPGETTWCKLSVRDPSFSASAPSLFRLTERVTNSEKELATTFRTLRVTLACVL